jgi:Flp pilus assembly protein TadG
VEFALVLPVMVVLMLTVIDLGRLFYSQMAITNAAREGAFQASLPASPAPGGTYDPQHLWYTSGSTCSSTTDAVTCRALLEFQGTPANWFVQPSPGDVTASCLSPTDATTGVPPCTSGIGYEAAVTVKTTFRLWSPWMGAFFGGHQTINLSATATSQVATMPSSTAPLTSNPTTGSIEVFKSTVGSDGTFTFTGTGTGLASQSPFSITTSGNEGSALFTSLAPGSYSVAENATSGWNLTSLSCVTSGKGGSTGTPAGTTATISLKAGDTVICTYTNTQSTTCSAPSAGFNATWTNGKATTTTTQSGIVATVPNGTAVTFTDNSTPPSSSCTGTQWSWSIVNNGNNGNNNTTNYSVQDPPSVTFYSQNSQQNGSYTVTLKVTNSAGSSSASMTITATP